MKLFKNYLLASMMLLGSIPAARADILTNGSFETTLAPWVVGSGINATSTGNGFAPDGGSAVTFGEDGHQARRIG